MAADTVRADLAGHFVLVRNPGTGDEFIGVSLGAFGPDPDTADPNWVAVDTGAEDGPRVIARSIITATERPDGWEGPEPVWNGDHFVGTEMTVPLEGAS